MSFLHYRDIGPGDRLLTLDNSSLKNVPLYEHLCDALPELPSCSGEKCHHCSIPLSIDWVAKQLQCGQVVHRSCAISIILSALSESDCEGSAVTRITCPLCGEAQEGERLLFPMLEREPKAKTAKRKESKPAPSDVTNLSTTLSKLSIHGFGTTAAKSKENNHTGLVHSLPAEDTLQNEEQLSISHLPTLSRISLEPQKQNNGQSKTQPSESVNKIRRKTKLFNRNENDLSRQFDESLHIGGHSMSERSDKGGNRNN